MNVSAPFIARPVATTLLAIAVLLAGITAFFFLPVAPLPRVEFPTIQVNAALPGASPETMASSVATPLERRFGRIAGVTEITSTSSLGATSITLQFDLDRDVDAAARDVQAAIAAAGAELPSNLPLRPNYRKVNPADTPTIILSLTSETIPLSQVFDIANTVLAQKIAQVPGVGQVFVGGGQQPAVRVQVDPELLAGLGLSLEDVRAAIASSTVDSPKGALSGASQSHVVAANDQLFGAAAFKDVIVAKDGAAAARLGDVARVFDDVENARVAAWSNGVRAVLLVIRRQPGANIIETNERVKAVVPELRRAISPAIKLEVATDRTQTIRESVHDVELTLVLSVFLVTAVVFAFLRSARATLVPSVAVPVSLVGTFGVMFLLGYSLDNLSLMALTISTGFVVDDAIVVTENVSRFIEAGETPLAAALKGAREIGFTIVSITASLLAVFIPLLLMGGIVGRLFREFAVTLSVAIAISAVVSLTLTPMMCSRLLRRARAEHEPPPARIFVWLERGFDFQVRTYGRALGWVLRHRTFMAGVTVATVFVTVALFVVVPKGLFPQQDTGMLSGISQAPEDVSFPAMKARQEALNAIVLADPDVAHAVSFIGSGFGASAGNSGNMFVDLRPKPPRTTSADGIIARLRPKIGQAMGVNLFLQAVQDVRVGGRPTRTQYQYTLQDADLDELRTWAPRLEAALRKVPELRDVASDQQTNGLELDVTIDRDTAARLGVTAQAVDDTLYDAFGQRQVATTFTGRNQYRVVLETKAEYSKHEADLKHVYVKTGGGGMAPLATFATAKRGNVPLSINHQGQFPSITLSFNLAPGKSLGEAIEAIHRAELAIGLPSGVRAAFQGTAQAFQDSLASQPLLVLAALFSVYVVLGMLYESYVHPITILSTLPSAGIGALLALLATGTEFSIIALIGMILLIGIVKKNAILMIDFAIESERELGLSPREAIERAALLRFRPIVMTTAAALLGGLPLALGSGVGSELRKPLGIAIVGGLVLSQLLTLFTTPVIYLALDRFTKKPDALALSRRSLRPPAIAPR